ncbi:MAG: DUF4386 domain-containing protein [Promethearchaeota archaeon]
MQKNKDIAKFLGLAYLIQFIASLLSAPLFDAALGSGTISDKLTNLSNNILLIHTSIVVQLITCLGIAMMTVLLYVVLEKENKPMALLALSFWLINVVFLAISSIGAYALVPLNVEYVLAGTPDPSYLLTLGSLLLGLKEYSFTLHMLFFAMGGILWYYLFYKSKKIPKYLALWGLIFIALMPIDLTLALFGFGFDSIWRMIAFLPYIPYIPFEGVMGIWFIVKGLDDTDSNDEG